MKKLPKKFEYKTAVFSQIMRSNNFALYSFKRKDSEETGFEIVRIYRKDGKEYLGDCTCLSKIWEFVGFSFFDLESAKSKFEKLCA